MLLNNLDASIWSEAACLRQAGLAAAFLADSRDITLGGVA